MLKQQEQNDLVPQQSTTTSDHQFWASITSRNKQLESNKVEVINPPAKPKIRFDSNNNSTTNQFMTAGFRPVAGVMPISSSGQSKQNQIEVFNPGASGLHVVEASVPTNQRTNSFTIGGSLSVGGAGKIYSLQVYATAAVLYLPGKLLLEGVSGDL